MSEQQQNRSLWQVLGIYAAFAWVCLQVVDVLTQNMALPKWVFVGTLGLLIVGLPITAATAYFQGTGSKNAHNNRPDANTGLRRIFKWRTVAQFGLAALAIWGIVITGWIISTTRESKDSELNLVTGIDEIRRLAGESDYTKAFEIAGKLDGLIENDTVRESMWSVVARPVIIQTKPAGATVFRRDYDSTEQDWQELGRTPVEVKRFPFGSSRLRFELDGYIPRETANSSSGFAAAPPYVLDTPASLPSGMVRISGGPTNVMSPGLEQLPELGLADFFMSVHEVTNRDYKKFVDSGGYRDRSCWKHAFIKDGQEISFENAVQKFVDTTGRPGPAGWEVGAYQNGEDDLPVGGVSWYEADAYACSVGKSLPTLYHWFRAADPFSSNRVVPLSNFKNQGPAPVAQYKGMSTDGVYDLAGNVREWAANRDGESHFILGGAWSDPEYAFNDAITSPSFDRSPENGIRLVAYPDAENVVAASGPIEKAFRNYYAEKPVSDDVFAVYRQMYDYDRIDLNAVVVSREENSNYVRERIEINAAYGGERLTVFIFLPVKNVAKPPYQGVVFFPGSGDLYKRSYDLLDINRIEFLVRSGRALIYPVYKGTFERGSELHSDVQDNSNLYRDHVIAWAKDIGRTIDYLEIRDDIDANRLAYYGISWGGAMAPVMTAIDRRFKASVLIVGGLMMQDVQPVADQFNFLPRVTVPTLMINGRYDSFFPLKSAINPFFETLGTPEADKKLIVTDSNHFVLSYSVHLAIRETLDWLDKYLGPVS